MTSPVLSLDLMRDLMLTANDRLGWQAKARRTKHLRDMAGWHGKAWKQRQKLVVPLDYRVRAETTLSFPTMRHRDQANWHPLLKPLVDGLVDAGVLAGDDQRYVVGPDIRFNDERCRKPFACHVEVRLQRA